MELNKYIKEVYDVAKDDAVVRQLLARSSPPFTSKKYAGFETSGFDCLVCIIRLIYSCLVTGANGANMFKLFADAEACNPILGYAWMRFDHLDLDGASEEDRAMWAHEKRAAAAAAVQGVFDGKNTTFANLYGSDLMKKTFWNLDVFRLPHDIARFTATQGWHSAPWNPVDAVSWSEVQLNRLVDPQMTLQMAIDGHLRSQEQLETGDIYRFQTPCFIRVYYCSGAQGDALPFKALQTFTVPVETLILQGNGLEKQEVDRCPYRLMGVVRMRKYGEKYDCIRSYDGQGNQIHPFIRITSYMSDTWSITEADREFILFYGLCPYALDAEPTSETSHTERLAQNEIAWVEKATNCLNRWRSSGCERSGSSISLSDKCDPVEGGLLEGLPSIFQGLTRSPARESTPLGHTAEPPATAQWAQSVEQSKVRDREQRVRQGSQETLSHRKRPSGKEKAPIDRPRSARPSEASASSIAETRTSETPVEQVLDAPGHPFSRGQPLIPQENLFSGPQGRGAPQGPRRGFPPGYSTGRGRGNARGGGYSQGRGYQGQMGGSGERRGGRGARRQGSGR